MLHFWYSLSTDLVRKTDRSEFRSGVDNEMWKIPGETKNSLESKNNFKNGNPIELCYSTVRQ